MQEIVRVQEQGKRRWREGEKVQSCNSNLTIRAVVIYLRTALNMSFRKSSVVIIDCGRRVVRAGRGVGEELLPAPTIVRENECLCIKLQH